METSQNEKQLPKLWSFIFIRVGIVTALMGIATQMFISAFPQYLNQLGFSATNMGLVASGYTVCAMIMRVFAGVLIDKKGRRVMCLLGLALFTAPVLGLMGATTVVMIVALRFTQGFGASLGNLAVGTMAPDVLPKERLGEGVAYFGLFNSLATAIGPAIGIKLVTGSNPRIFFMTSFVMGLAAMFVASTVNYEKKGKKADSKSDAPELTPEEAEAERLAQAEEQANAQRCFIWRFFDKRAVPAAIVTILVTISTVSITTFVTPYGIEIGLSSIGTFFTAQAITMIFARLASGKLQRRLGRFKTMVLGLFCDIIALILLATMTNNMMMYAAAIMRGWGGGIYFPLLNVLSVENASRSGRGKAVSTYYAAYDLGAGIGAAIWGVVADMFGKVSMAAGYRALFAGAALFYIVIVPATFKFLGKVDQPRKS